MRLAAHVLVALLALPAAAREPPGLALASVSAGANLDEGTAHTFEEVLLSSLQRTGRFRVIGRADLLQLVGFERQRQMLGCANDECVAELGGALGVPLVGAADLGRLGGSLVVTLKIIDVHAVRVVVRATRALQSEAELPAACEELAQEAAKAFPPPPVRELGLRAGLGGLTGVFGVGAEARLGRFAVGLGTGSHLLTGGFCVRWSPEGGGPYADVHAAWVRTGLIGQQPEPGWGAGATVGWDVRPLPWLSVKAGLGLAWRRPDEKGAGPLTADLNVGPVWQPGGE